MNKKHENELSGESKMILIL